MGVGGYDVQYSSNEAFTDQDEIIARTAEQISYRREGLSAETSAYLRVRSAGGTGEDRITSAWSTHVTGMTDAAGGTDGSVTTFREGERIPDFPTGVPNRVSGGSFSISGGVATITLRRDGYVEYSEHRYTCDASGCGIRAGLVTDGVIVRTATGGGGTPNGAPRAVGSISDQTLTEDGSATTVNVAARFSDPDGDDLGYRATSSRTSVVRVSVSGSRVTLTPRDAGTATVTVTATDPGGLSAIQRFTVTVTAANRAPRAVGSIPDQTLTEDGSAATVNVSARFSDPDRDDLSYRATSSRTSVVRVSVSGSRVTLTPRDAGMATVTVTATDPGGLSAAQTFSVRVDVGGGADFEAFNGLRIGTDGSVMLRVGGINLSAGRTRCIFGGARLNGQLYDYHWTAWQRNTGSGWNEVSGSRQTGGLCGYDLTSALSGNYRLVGDMTLAGERGRYRSENEVTVGGGSGTNRAPRAVGSIPAQTLTEDGSATTVNVSARFSDPDGDALSYRATSSRTSVVRVSVSGSRPGLRPDRCAALRRPFAELTEAKGTCEIPERRLPI